MLINTFAFPRQGAKGDNATLISEVGNFIKQLGHGWWLWSGDFNMEEKKLLDSSVPGALFQPWRWATAEGDILDILSSSPYRVRSRVEQAALTKHSPHGVTHWALCRELLADKSATARLLRASRDDTHPIGLLSREQRGAAKAVLEGKTWPAARKATLNIGSGYCPHCGHHWEDEQHRLWHCPAFQHIREQHGMTVDRFKALELWDHEDFRATLRPPLRWFKVDSVQQSRSWGEPADWWTQGHPLTGVVCSDGSLLDPGPCARAAWGIMQVGLQGFELAGTLAGPQTVPRAELTAVCVAAELATLPLVVEVDHFNLAAHWADAQGRLDDCLNSPLLDLWERLQAAIAEWPQGSFAIRWIPSHMDEFETNVREARWRKACAAGSIPAAWIAGNHKADELAGLAALEHRLPWSLRNRQRSSCRCSHSSGQDRGLGGER